MATTLFPPRWPPGRRRSWPNDRSRRRLGIGLAIVPDGRVALADLARRFWGEPDRRLGLIGVTGTDGKTSTSRLIAWMLGAYVAGVGELTTVNTRAGGADLKKSGRLTTPEAPTVARLLARMVPGWRYLGRGGSGVPRAGTGARGRLCLRPGRDHQRDA